MYRVQPPTHQPLRHPKNNYYHFSGSKITILFNRHLPRISPYPSISSISHPIPTFMINSRPLTPSSPTRIAGELGRSGAHSGRELVKKVEIGWETLTTKLLHHQPITLAQTHHHHHHHHYQKTASRHPPSATPLHSSLLCNRLQPRLSMKQQAKLRGKTLFPKRNSISRIAYVLACLFDFPHLVSLLFVSPPLATLSTRKHHHLSILKRNVIHPVLHTHPCQCTLSLPHPLLWILALPS